jgi:endonuclease YncB( thermonuclease family)
MTQYVVIRGEYIVVGKEPDGDSIRFRADNPGLLKQLKNGERVKVSQSDQTVQLRFQGIDAPELHYQGEAQPFGRQSRNVLLNELDFGLVRYSNLKVISAERRVQGAILAKETEKYGRPISYVLWEDDADGLEDGSQINIGKSLLEKSINYLMLEQGMAYPLFYTSMPSVHQNTFKAVAKKARDGRIGLWPQDLTRNFDLTDNESIGPNGQLIFPKLFRRCTDYLHDLDHQNFDGSLREWMAAKNKNDPTQIADGSTVEFASLISEEGTRISLDVDLFDLVFEGD